MLPQLILILIALLLMMLHQCTAIASSSSSSTAHDDSKSFHSARQRSLQDATNTGSASASLGFNSDRHTYKRSLQDATNTNSGTETPLGTSCTIVGDEFVCDISMVLFGNTTTTGAGTGNIDRDSEVAVEAVLTCPFKGPEAFDAANANANATQEIDFANTEPSTCECLAGLSYVHTSRAAKECQCQYCLDPTKSATPSADAIQLSIDCSANTGTEDPFIHSNCQQIACDGTCIKTGAVATPKPTSAPTAAPVTASPTASPTITLLSTANGKVPWWIPIGFYVSNEKQLTAEQLLNDAQAMEGLQRAFRQLIQQEVIDVLLPAPPTAAPSTMAPNNRGSNATIRSRWLQQQQQTTKIVYAPIGTAIYHMQDEASCPQEPGKASLPILTRQGNSPPPCQLVFGRFQIVLQSNQPADLDVINSEYKLATDIAVATQLQAVLDANGNVNNNPRGIVILKTDATKTTPLVANNQGCSLCPNGTPPNQLEAPFPLPPDGVTAVDGFGCSQLVANYRQQSAAQCLNYGVSAALQTQMPPLLRNFVTQQLPLEYPTHCACPANVNAIPNTHTTCPVFCPDNKRVPAFNRNVLIDAQLGLTCGLLETYANSIADLSYCETLARHGALCCTRRITKITPPTVPFVPETPPPRGTSELTIPSRFMVYNLQAMTADVVMLSPEWQGLQRAYENMVKQVVSQEWNGGSGSSATVAPSSTSSNNTSSNATTTTPAAAEGANTTSRYLRRSSSMRHHRQLGTVTLPKATNAIQVHDMEDIECDPKRYPRYARCANVSASYKLWWNPDGDDDTNGTIIAEQYTNATQQAIDAGLLNETLEDIDPLTELIIEGALPIPPYVPPVPPRSPEEKAQEGGYDEYWMSGVGISIAIIVICLVAILCASDLSGNMDDESEVDPWEKKEPPKKSTVDPHLHLEKAPSQKSLASSIPEDPNKRTERQEYELYREQVELLIDKKSPEEMDNVDELMDLFYKREMILIATLQHMPDAESDIPESAEFDPNNNDDMNNVTESTEARFNDSMFWNSEDGSSGEFAEESTSAFDRDFADEPSNRTDGMELSQTIHEGDDEDAEDTDDEHAGTEKKKKDGGDDDEEFEEEVVSDDEEYEEVVVEEEEVTSERPSSGSPGK